MQLALFCTAFSMRFVIESGQLNDFKLIAFRMSITLAMEVYTQN